MRRTVSGIMLILLMLNMLTLAFNIHPVKAEPGTIYIRADGNIDPPTAPIQRNGDIYTFTDNIYDSIVVERSNIIIDGAGYTLQGSGSEYGFDLYGINSVVIKNTNIKEFGCGIRFQLSSNNVISGNNIANNHDGVSLQASPNNVLRNNNIIGNRYNFGVFGYTLSDFIQDVDTSNTVDGRPIYYWVNRQDQEVPSDAGYVALINSTNIILRGLLLKNNLQGVLLAYTKNSQIIDNKITNNSFGVSLPAGSSGNVISGNNIIDNEHGGVHIYAFSSNNVISRNNISNNLIGVSFASSSPSNVISANNITNNGYGVSLWSSDNTISENDIKNNEYGIYHHYLSGNEIYHNNFINNLEQAYVATGYTNAWDNGYPSGGNYWSDYSDVDLNNDGIWDHPYVIDANNQDRYPLINPYGVPTPPPKFSIGDWVRTTANLNVREGPGLGYAIIDTMPEGTLGQIMGGPVEADGYVWWDVNYVVDVRGWSAQNWLELSTAPPPNQPPQPINIEPPDGATDVSLEPMFLSSPPLSDLTSEQIPWEELDGIERVTKVYYHIQITTVPGDYSGPVYDFTDYWLIDKFFDFPPSPKRPYVSSGVLDYGTTYYWRIRYKDFRDVWSPWSEETSFTTRQPYSPVADAGSDKSASSGDIVLFDGSNSYHPEPDREIVSYRWEFGDGGTAEGHLPVAEHRFRGTQNEPKTYIVTLTVEDNYGAVATDTAFVTVRPLRKLVDVGPGYFGVSCWMEVTYNWVGTDEVTGENLYIISKIQTYSGGISGAYQLFILRRTSPPPSIPKLVWYIPLPTAPVLRTYVTPFTPSVWQELWGEPAEITTLTFQEGTFQGIGVTDTSLMLIVATGTETGITLYYDAGLTKFEPDSPIVRLKPEELKELWELRDIIDLLNKIIGIIGSPCELRIYNSEGHVTGLVNGEIKEEIPGSAYTNDTILILYANDTYRYEMVGIDEGAYKLLIISVENVNATTFTATEIPTSSNAIHQYTINWTALSQGEEGVTVQVDSEGDGVFEYTFASDSELTHDEFIQQTSPTYALTITVTVGGTTDPAPGTYSYTANTTVQVTAIPDANYIFDHWELDTINVGSANPYTVLMDNNHTLKAVFTYSPPPPPSLTVSISPLSASILVGPSVTFTSTVSGGTTPYSYQWYLNGAPVSGATSNTWTFTPTTGGIYYVHLKVTDDKGNTAQSDAARITAATVPVGGYSIPIQLPTTAKPVTPYIALLTILTAIFITVKRKTKRKH